MYINKITLDGITYDVGPNIENTELTTSTTDVPSTNLMKTLIDEINTQINNAISRISTNETNINKLNAEILNIPYFNINYTAENKAEALDLIDNPKHIIGMDQQKVSPYVIIFVDSVGDSHLTGGVSLVIGYEYPRGTHGAQLLIKYNKIQTRGKIENSWSDWVDIK